MNKRRLLSILTCLALCLTLLPTAALAAAVGETIHVGGVKLTTTAENPTVYARTVEGAVTTDGANESSYNIMWDGETLTLNNADITQGSYKGAAIYRTGGLEIELLDENKVSNPGGESGIYHSFGIYAEGGLTISGSGSLAASGGGEASTYYSYGIYVSGDLTVSGGEVTAAGGEASTYYSYGIYVSGGLTVSGGEVTAEGTTQAVRIYSGGSVTVAPAEGQQIAVTAGADESSAAAIIGSPFTSEEEISDSSISSAKYFHSIAEAAGDPGSGGDTDPDPNIYVGGVGLYGDQDTPAYALTDGDGNVTTENADEDNYTIMWDGETLTLNNAVITQGSHENAAIYHYDHYTAIHLVLMGESTVTGPSSSEGSCGIDVSGDLTISGSGTLTVTGGDVTAAGTNYAESYGIDAPDIIISGGTVNATGGTVSGNHAISYGIDASDITISGGTVNATGGTAASGSADDSDAESCGIYATGGVTISGGAVTATGGSASGNSLSFGINAENVTVSDGTATATGGEVSGNNTYSCGINATMGVTISGGEVTAEGDTQAVRTTGTVIIDPAEGQQIAVTAGTDADNAVKITDSPFTSEKEISDSSISSAQYFHSIAEAAGDPDPEPEPNIYVGGVGLYGDKDTPAYALTDESGKVTTTDAGEDNYNIMWDGETLTLEDAVITQSSYSGVAIYCGEDAGIHLVLVGDSTVTVPGGDASRGIYTGGELTISGDGTLDVSGGGISLFVNGDLTISDGSVTATGGGVSANDAYSYGIFTPYDITISGGSVTAKGGAAEGDSAESFGIFADNLTISGGTVNAVGGTASATGNESYACSYGIYARDVIVSDGEVTATGGTASAVNKAYSNGIDALRITVAPAEREQITVTVGADESSAAEITGSPFQEETEITGLASAAGVAYFKSEAEPARYSVTLHPNGGTIADGKDVTSYLCGTGASLPGAGVVTRSGYRFAGWYADEALTDGPYTQISASDAGDMAFYARWVRRSSSGGGGSSSSRPAGPSTGHSDGWTDIREEIGSAEDGDTVTIDMNGETEVPAEIFEEIAGKDITVELDMGGGVTWTVDGRDVPEDVSLSDLDLGVDMDTSGISVDVINTVTGEYGAVQVSLDHDGAFGFALTLTAPLGRENAGYWANLYHYDEGEEALTFETSARIAADGSAALRMTHASQYAIVIDEKSHALPFEDVGTDAWYSDAVAYVYRNGLMSGTSGSTFSPDAAITRAQLVTILWRMADSPQVNGLMDFDDVSQDAYYTEAVRWAASEGIAGGYGNGLFGSDDPITREQMAAILYRFAQHMGYDVSIGEDTNILSYTDAPDVSGYAVAALQWACGAGIIRGTGDGSTLTPQGGATRAQAAVILTRFCAQSQ